MFIRFDTNRRTCQTDGQTPHDGIGRATHSVARQKKQKSTDLHSQEFTDFTGFQFFLSRPFSMTLNAVCM